MSAADLHPTPTYTATIHSTASSTADTSGSTGKRLLFGRKKKSSINLGGSPSTTTLTPQSGSLQGNHSVENLGGVGDDGTSAIKKGVKNVFKRKTRVENTTSSGSIGSVDDKSGIAAASIVASAGGSAGADGDGSLEDEEESLRTSDDSDTQTPKKNSAELLSTISTPTSTKASGKPKLFGRRSTSPMATVAQTNVVMGKSPSKENTKISTLERPSTSEGSSRPSQDRGRRAGRMSISTTDASDITPVSTVILDTASRDIVVPGAAVSSTYSNRRTSAPGVRITTTLAEPSDGAPMTTITPPTPTDGAAHFPAKSPVGVVVNETPSGKRSRTNSLSNATSKLSQSMTNDGVTSSENPSTTGGGFFQSMFSAAHNAATSLTNTIPLNLANNQANRERTTTLDSADTAESSTDPPESKSSNSDEQPEREPAVKTLGFGELNLATLGIAPEPVMTTQTDGVSVVSARGNGNGDDEGPKEFSKRFSAPQSATTAHSGFETAGESPIAHRAVTPYAEDVALRTSIHKSRGGNSVGDLTPDSKSLTEPIDDEDGTDGDRKRSGSVRSGDMAAASTKKRHRGSSAASQGNLPILAAPKPTGFAVATQKRDRDFHNLFKSVPVDDLLIEDYGCALQKEILLQGRLYVSGGHICFYSNILGWVTTLVISFDEVMSVEKKSTALLFPNAIVIQTLHARHVFASFISRDSTYDLILGLWNVGHPQVTTGSEEGHLDGAPSGGDSGNEEDGEYDDESEDDLGESFTDAGDSQSEENNTPPTASKNPSRKPSQLPIGNGAPAGDSAEGGYGTSGDFPGPKAHAPTACGDDDKHYDKLLCNEVLSAPLGRIHSLLFGAASFPFITQLLSEEEKVLELQIPNNGEWAEQDGKKTRTFSYVKPLSGSIGPSKTRCIITETINHYDLEDHVSVTVSTQTPDVPSGGVFSVKTRYCLMWGEGNGTRLITNCTVEWTGKSWIKGPIEKGASDGQIAYSKSLLTCLRREIAPRRAVGKAGGKGKGRRRNAGAGGVATGRTVGGANGAAAVTTPPADTWGMLEPLKPIFGPVADIFGPLLPANFGVIVITIVLTWFVSGMLRPATKGGDVVRGGRYAPQHRWEDMWMDQEEGLWEWLEDRAGINSVPSLRQNSGKRTAFEKKLAKTAGSGMKDRQVEEAISVIKERLGSLERIVEEKKSREREEL